MAFDGANDLLYVIPFTGNFTTAVNPETGTVVATIPTGTDPDAIAFDPDNGYLYVANSGSGNLSVVDGTTNAVVGSIALNQSPVALAYDATNHYIYAAGLSSSNGTSYGPSNVTIINPSSSSVSGTVLIGYPEVGGGGGADGLTFDNAQDELVVTYYFPNVILLNAYSGAVAVNGTTNTLNEISVPYQEGMALRCAQYDPVADEIFLCDGNTASAFVVDGETSRVVGSDPVGASPVAGAYDPANDAVLIVNSGSNNVTEINGTTGQIAGSAAVGLDPNSAVYDSINCEVYVANTGSNNLTALFQGQACHPPTYTVTFSESGLPANSSWWINLNGGQSIEGNASSIGTLAHNGTYSWTAACADKRYYALEGMGHFELSGSPLRVTVNFRPVTFLASFVEVGLPPGTIWSVTLNETNGSTSTQDNESVSGGGVIAFPATNGTYRWSVNPIPGHRSNVSSGSFTINGRGQEVSVNFTSVPTVGGAGWSFGGLDAFQWTSLLLSLIVVAAVVTVVLVRRSRRARMVVPAESTEPPKANPPP